MSERREYNPSELDDDTRVLLYVATGGALTEAEQSDAEMQEAARLRAQILSSALGRQATLYEVQGLDEAVA